MTGYGQFCPLAKATELIGEKWTLLILRELFLGTTRFNDFQRAMCRMSPTYAGNGTVTRCAAMVPCLRTLPPRSSNGESLPSICARKERRSKTSS